jgi:two-component system, OmpR family, KDP operon response regulator KdpE
MPSESGMTSEIASLSRRKTRSAAPKALKPLVLVVESDAQMRCLLRSILADHGFRIVEAKSGAQALATAEAYQPDLVVLEFGLPDCDALDVTTELRAWTASPILVLAGAHDENDKIAVLDAGANDFVAKPFRAGEFLARVRVWLRHTQRATVDSLDSTIQVGALKLDFATRIATVNGHEVRLTPTQYKILAVMMRNAGKVLTYDQILEAVWGPAYTAECQCLRVHMANLREKLDDDAAHQRYFLTEPGVGYRLRLQDPSSESS